MPCPGGTRGKHKKNLGRRVLGLSGGSALCQGILRAGVAVGLRRLLRLLQDGGREGKKAEIETLLTKTGCGVQRSRRHRVQILRAEAQQMRRVVFAGRRGAAGADPAPRGRRTSASAPQTVGVNWGCKTRKRRCAAGRAVPGTGGLQRAARRCCAHVPHRRRPAPGHSRPKGCHCPPASALHFGLVAKPCSTGNPPASGDRAAAAGRGAGSARCGLARRPHPARHSAVSCCGRRGRPPYARACPGAGGVGGWRHQHCGSKKRRGRCASLRSAHTRS